MGVPAFFRWLSLKYNRIVSHCVEEKRKRIDDDTTIPVNTSLPNPNNVEFDNLYLDMNGIIHPCTHPENKPAPKNEEEMFFEIFLYIDRIFSVVRPRRLIYMAVDGVAPRAKMNQQRSRRFRAGKETREKTLTIARLRSELLLKGMKLPEAKSAGEHFDSNCITPGTPFMARLALALQYYVYDRLNSDPGWAGIQVVLSDASAPGEGEHKIMDYIRRQRASGTHDANTRHCLCGADADLIMLGLATHEPYFTIIREEFKPNQPRPCELCGQMNHTMEECQGLESTEFNTGVNSGGVEAEFIFIHINILREYLYHDLLMVNLPFEYDFERAIDDWVFMCFFVGNDFLPHLPSLEIREKAIDRLISLYKASVYKTNGWLTDSGKVNLERVQLIMKDLALVEDEIFKSRRETEVDFRRKGKMRRVNNKRQRLDQSPSFNRYQNAEFVRPNMGERFSKDTAISEAKSAMSGSRLPVELGKRKHDAVVLDEEDLRNKELDERDGVKLWEEGYRKRYYERKFGVSVEENAQFCVDVAHEYVRGLCWVLAYYYQGCPSWTWYYPYHYAPFAEDFLAVADTDVSFPMDSEPFKPLEQLMGVFPADSRAHVPPAWHGLMTDADSPLIDFYPTDFKVDLNGKRFDWQGVALLPFVDEGRLLSVLAACYDGLTEDERERNVRGPDRYFVRADHPIVSLVGALVAEEEEKELGGSPLVRGVAGRVWRDPKASQPGTVVPSAVSGLCEDIKDVQAVSCFYRDPQYPRGFLFPATLLKDVVMPPKSLGPEALRIEQENRSKRCLDTKPMGRMIRHSLPERLGSAPRSVDHAEYRGDRERDLGGRGSASYNSSGTVANNKGRNSQYYGSNPNLNTETQRSNNQSYNGNYQYQQAQSFGNNQYFGFQATPAAAQRGNLYSAQYQQQQQYNNSYGQYHQNQGQFQRGYSNQDNTYQQQQGRPPNIQYRDNQNPYHNNNRGRNNRSDRY